MAKTNKKVLKVTFAVWALGVGSANASDLWLTSNPLFDALSASSSTSSSYGVSSLSSQWTGTSGQTTSQWSVASADNSSWFSSNWSTGASTAQTPALADDLYRSVLFTGGSSSSASVSTASSTGGSWFSSYFGSQEASTATSSNSSWANNWGSSSSSNLVSSGWWNTGSSWGVSSGAAASSGAWWSSYGGWGGTAAVSSDNTACNMVSTWAGVPSWRDHWNDAGTSTASSSVATSTCNQTQSSTIGNLATSNNLVATNAPIGGDPVVIEDFNVPEPQTWMLMAGGLAMIGYTRRKRNAA